MAFAIWSFHLIHDTSPYRFYASTLLQSLLISASSILDKVSLSYELYHQGFKCAHLINLLSRMKHLIIYDKILFIWVKNGNGEGRDETDFDPAIPILSRVGARIGKKKN